MAHTSLKYFRQVLSVVTQFDVTESDCLNAAGLDAIPSTDRVNADHISEILKFAAKHLDDPLIGIRCGLKYPILQYTRPSEFLKLCQDVTEAAELFRAYSPLFHTVGTSSAIVSENLTDRIIWTPNFTPDCIGEKCLHVDFIMTNYLTSINWLIWQISNPVQRLHFKHDPMVPIQHYKDLLKCDVKFGQAEYAIILQDNVKNSPFATSDPIELAKVKLTLDMAMNELLAAESLLDRIELQIRRAIEDEALQKAAIAKTLGMSERNMSRALADKGTSYKELKNNVLKDLAYIKINKGLPLAKIAHSLGYNDQSAFTRAYKKWYGHPPGKVKQLQ